MAAAYDAGGRDNVTAVVVDIDSDDDDADETTLPREALPWPVPPPWLMSATCPARASRWPATSAGR